MDQNMIFSLFDKYSGTVVIVAFELFVFGLILFKVYAKEFVTNQVRHDFNILLEEQKCKQSIALETHKAELQKMIEEAKVDNTRRTQDFSLYSQKRHSAYMELHELTIANNSAVSRILINFGPDFWHMTDDEIKRWLDRYEFGQMDKDSVLSKLGSKSNAVAELGTLWHRYTINQAEVSFAWLKNCLLASKLYMSATVTDLLNEFTKKSSLLMTCYSSKADLGVTPEQQTNLDKELSNLIDSITITMKAELQRGYYSED